MANKNSNIRQTKAETSTVDDDHSLNFCDKTLETIWKPALNEYELGVSPEMINSHLPIPFRSFDWTDLPQANEYKHEEVRYFWLRLNRYGKNILKFIPPNTSVNATSYICFLFIKKKLFQISVRFFHDAEHRNYNDTIELYAKAIHTPVITSDYGKEFHYEDNRIIYFSCFSSDKSHIFIDLIRKDQTKSTDGYYDNRLSFHHNQTRIMSLKPFISNQSKKYDIMISYSHKDKDLCHQISSDLLNSQYRVWMDPENMNGATIKRMVEAVENTQFVLLCMSNSYQSSYYCQLEAESAFKCQCILIPLIVKKDFTPSGWLKLLCGLRFRIDFTKTTFEEAFDRLLKEIQRYRTFSIENNQLS